MATIVGEERIQGLRFNNTSNKPVEVTLYRKRLKSAIFQFTVGAGAVFNWDANPGGDIITNGDPLYLNTNPQHELLVAHGNGIIEAAIDQEEIQTTLETRYPAEQDMTPAPPEPQYEDEWYEPCDDPTENWMDDEPLEPLQVSVDDIGDQMVITDHLPTLKNFKMNASGVFPTTRTTGIAHTKEVTVD